VYKNYEKIAAELVALKPTPAAIVAACGPSLWELLEKTKDIPIVYTAMTESWSSPVGNNATGFHSYGVDLSVRLLDLLREIAPRVTKAAVIWDQDPDPQKTAGKKQIDQLRARAQALGVQLTEIDVNAPDADIEGSIAVVAGANGGLIVTASTLAAVRRKLIIALAAKHGLPAIYPNRMYVTSGGLISYGAVTLDMYEHAGKYVARILTGTSPPHLPRRKNDKFETVVKLSAAAALGLTLPPAVLARADQIP
jgi:putative ABC transport system substrate-binding protein